MTAVAPHAPTQQFNDLTEIVKMVLIAAITLVLMALATSTPSGANAPAAPTVLGAQSTN